jgi:hypothetical protein
MTLGEQILNLAVVCPLVADVEGRGNGAPVRVGPVGAEDVLVQVLVQVAHRIVESQNDDLGWVLDALQFWKGCKNIMSVGDISLRFTILAPGAVFTTLNFL